LREVLDQNPENQEARWASFLKEEIVLRLLEETFVHSSQVKTVGPFTVISTQAAAPGHRCPGEYNDLLTLFKDDTQNLGTVCGNCGRKVRLIFPITPEVVKQIEKRIEEEDASRADFTERLKHLGILPGQNQNNSL
jgi:hypothetical protein